MARETVGTQTEEETIQTGEMALRRFLLGDLIGLALLIFLGWFLYNQRSELGNVAQAITSGYWPWLVAAGLLEIAYLFVNARYYQAALAAFGSDFALVPTLAIRLTAEILSVLTASEFLTTQAVFLYHARARAYSRSRTAFGVLIAQLAELATFFIILVPALAVLIQIHRSQGYELAAGYTLLALFVVVIGVLALFLVRPGYVIRLLRFGQRLAAAFGRRRFISETTIRRARQALREIMTILRQESRTLLPVGVVALLGQALRLSCFLAVLMAFHVDLSLSFGLVSYAIGTLVWIISPIPQGIGLVEGAYGLALVSFGVNPAVATTVALGFRGIVFWLPFLGGLPAFRRFRPRNGLATAPVSRPTA